MTQSHSSTQTDSKHISTNKMDNKQMIGQKRSADHELGGEHKRRKVSMTQYTSADQASLPSDKFTDEEIRVDIESHVKFMIPYFTQRETIKVPETWKREKKRHLEQSMAVARMSISNAKSNGYDKFLYRNSILPYYTVKNREKTFKKEHAAAILKYAAMTRFDWRIPCSLNGECVDQYPVNKYTRNDEKDKEYQDEDEDEDEDEEKDEEKEDDKGWSLCLYDEDEDGELAPIYISASIFCRRIDVFVQDEDVGAALWGRNSVNSDVGRLLNRAIEHVTIIAKHTTVDIAILVMSFLGCDECLFETPRLPRFEYMP